MGEESNLDAPGPEVTYAWRKFEKNMEWNRALLILFSFEGRFHDFSVTVITISQAHYKEGACRHVRLLCIVSL